MPTVAARTKLRGVTSSANEEIRRLEETEVLAHLLDAHVARRIRRSIAIGVVRWTITAIVYWWFWDLEWLRWTLVVTVPSALYFAVSMWRLRRTSDARTLAISRQNDVLLERTGADRRAPPAPRDI